MAEPTRTREPAIPTFDDEYDERHAEACDAECGLAIPRNEYARPGSGSPR